ncbi:YhdT family protein [Oceanobacillus caeni]|uniref:YhdT family protein n=1 Tax=Oceanobacillus caeni TaxID=405946 RepID=UPI002E1B7BB1|nr:YhdT family protein [Oceanobacillus caeni]
MNKDKENQKVDYRIKIGNREALIGVGLFLFNFVWWFAFAYGLGSKDPFEYSYVFGFPSWFFYSCVLGSIIICILVFIIVKGFFKDIPFEDEELKDK